MKAITVSFVALFIPAVLCAQIGGQVTVSNVARTGCASVSGSARMKVNLESTHDAMVAAGRMHPSDEECARGASAMERGVTKLQIEAIAKSTQGDRSLVVAFDVLGKLAASGMPVNQAVAQVQQNVSAGASDATLTALVGANGTAGVANADWRNAAAAGNGAPAAKPVGGTLTTTVSGVIKKP